MKTALLFLLASLLFTDLDKIGKINSAKAEAKKAFLSGDFTTAIKKYTYLIDSLGVNEDEVRANLASAYFQANDTTGALNNYQRLTQSANKKISSVANQQLGVMANNQEKLEESLNYFKQALKAAPENDEARYNYEIVKKKLEEKKKQDQQKNKDQKDQDKKDDQKKDQKDQNKEDKKDQKEKDPKDQKEKEQKEKEQKEKEEQEKNKDKKDIPPSVSEKLKEMQMSEEKAKMILEAMKNQEVQYLQQNKRKATKPKDKGKPDW
jgi:hypothetical protein